MKDFSDEEDDELGKPMDFNPEDYGLHFDRARMNSSNRRSIDHYKH